MSPLRRRVGRTWQPSPLLTLEIPKHRGAAQAILVHQRLDGHAPLALVTHRPPLAWRQLPLPSACASLSSDTFLSDSCIVMRSGRHRHRRGLSCRHLSRHLCNSCVTVRIRNRKPQSFSCHLLNELTHKGRQILCSCSSYCLCN